MDPYFTRLLVHFLICAWFLYFLIILCFGHFPCFWGLLKVYTCHMWCVRSSGATCFSRFVVHFIFGAYLCFKGNFGRSWHLEVFGSFSRVEIILSTSRRPQNSIIEIFVLVQSLLDGSSSFFSIFIFSILWGQSHSRIDSIMCYSLSWSMTLGRTWPSNKNVRPLAPDSLFSTLFLISTIGAHILTVTWP